MEVFATKMYGVYSLIETDFALHSFYKLSIAEKTLEGFLLKGDSDDWFFQMQLYPNMG